MEEALDIPPMDLKATAEQEVLKLQDMVKRLEKQNEILRHSQSSQNGGGQADVLGKRDSIELEEVTLVNLNDSSDDLEESWLYESPVKPATPAQKSVSTTKWTKTSAVDGLDDIRGNLIDKLDDIETQQEISKVRVAQTSEGKASLMNTPKNSLFFQPTSKTSRRNGDSAGQVNRNIKIEDDMYDNTDIDYIDDDMDETPQGPILRRSAIGKETKSRLQQSANTSELDDENEESQAPILRRSALGKNSPKNDLSKFSQSDDIEDEMQGPIFKRSAVSKGSPKTERQHNMSDMSDDMSQGPILRRSALAKDVKTSPSQLNGSSDSQRQAVNTSPKSRMQPRSRRMQLQDDDIAESRRIDTSSQSSQDDFDDDTNDKVPIVRRSALALPKPSSEGLSKQLWYSGPVNQMNKQRSKVDSPAVRRSVSPSPDRRNKLQSRSPGPASGVAARRSAGSRGSMEDLLDVDDTSPIQRRSLPQVPTDMGGTRSRAARSDEGIRKQVPRSKAQNLQQPQGNTVARRSKLAAPNSTSKGVVARRKAPSQADNDLDDSWKEGCY